MVSVHQGSILGFEGDCIVNPANSFLRHDGGLARVIEDAAIGTRWRPRAGTGSDAVALYVADHQRAPLVATGTAHWTSAGRLPYRGIVHAVGPIWAGGVAFEHELLACAHEHAMLVAKQHGCESVAFPAISCGVFGFPVELAATIATRAVTRLAPELELDVAFYLLSDGDHGQYAVALAGLS